MGGTLKQQLSPVKYLPMHRRIYYTLFSLLLFSSSGFSQQLSGKIFKKGTTDPLPGVNIKNQRAQTYNTSDAGGNYKIMVLPRDTLFFTSAGYKPDTAVVSNAIIVRDYDVYLSPNVVMLAEIEVDPLNKYLADSVRRREEYAFILDKKHPVKLMNEKRAADAPGFSFSPAGYFSKTEKQKRRLKQRLKDEEERDRQTYIDARFPRNRIARITKLQGDSLNRFMLLNRPDFTFCRNTSNQDLLLYINDKLVLFRQGKK